MKEKIKIAVIGFRGFPNVEGGVENHCQNLYPRMARSGQYQFFIFRRKRYVIKGMDDFNYKDISFIDLVHPTSHSLEAAIHTISCIIYTIFRIRDIDIVHIHNIGPGIFIPVLKLFKYKTILTYHSDNYNHSKWNLFQKLVLKLGEVISTRFADRIICISPLFVQKIKEKQKCFFIPNGVEIHGESNCTINEEIGIKFQRYLLFVGRLSAEKGIEVLLKAFKNVSDDSVGLIVVGSCSDRKYKLKLEKLASDKVTFLGEVNHNELHNYYRNAELFLLPSYNEGLSISVLEAISFGIPIIISDIPNNRIFNLPTECYFKSGDHLDLANSILQTLEKPVIHYQKDEILKDFCWDKIINQTNGVFISLSKK